MSGRRMMYRKEIYWELACWEWKKLCRVPMLYVFFALCIVFNMQLVLEERYGEDYVAYVKQARHDAGSRMGDAFWERVESFSDGEEKERLLRETKGAQDIFEAYDALDTAALIVNKYRMDGWTAAALGHKYQKQARRIQKLAASDASLDVGAAGMTKTIFDALFEKLCRAVLTEGLLLAVFAALFCSGSEQFERTWQLVYTSRRGRSVQREKLLAGLLFAAAMYVLLALVSCAVFAGSWRLGEIWETHMSTQFYDAYSMGIRLPFVPWADFTMRGYLAAVLLLGLVLAVVFYLLGYLAGLLAKNSYAGFAAVFVASALNLEVIMLAGNAGSWGIYEAAMWTPAGVWLLHPLWFTDMGIHAVIPWQECTAAALCLAAAAVLLSCGFCYYNRKDLK